MQGVHQYTIELSVSRRYSFTDSRSPNAKATKLRGAWNEAIYNGLRNTDLMATMVTMTTIIIVEATAQSKCFSAAFPGSHPPTHKSLGMRVLCIWPWYM